MGDSFELWCCYAYLCEAYDRLLGGDRVLFVQGVAHALSRRNAQNRHADLRLMTTDTKRHPLARHLSFEEIAHVAARSRLLGHFGAVGQVRETLWGPVDALGRVRFKRHNNKPQFFDISHIWTPADRSRSA